MSHPTLLYLFMYLFDVSREKVPHGWRFYKDAHNTSEATVLRKLPFTFISNYLVFANPGWQRLPGNNSAFAPYICILYLRAMKLKLAVISSHIPQYYTTSLM